MWDRSFYFGSAVFAVVGAAIAVAVGNAGAALVLVVLALIVAAVGLTKR